MIHPTVLQAGMQPQEDTLTCWTQCCRESFCDHRGFFFPFQVLHSPVWVPGQFSHKLDLPFDGELAVTTLRMCRVTLVTASWSGCCIKEQRGGEKN